MKNPIIFLSISFLSIFLIACNGNSDGSVEIEIHFPAETLMIDKEYPEIDPTAIDIMEKFRICTLQDSLTDLPLCAAENFRIFKYQPEKGLESGFIVEMVPGLFGSPVHQVIVIENVFGKYKIVNQYLGYLLEMRTTASGYNDLLIAYDDQEIGVVAIKHVWKVDKYDLADVEEINDHYIKPELKDSINNILLPAFTAGH